MKVATIGSGVIVDRMIQAIQETENLELYAVYSRTMERAQEFAKAHGVNVYYDNLDAMLQDDAIDIVYVASPNSLHYEQSKRALQARKHVICEKPFCSTVLQAQELFDLAKANGVYIFEAITNIHTPNFRLIQKQLKRCGEIKLVQCNFSQFSSKYVDYKNHKQRNVFDLNFDGGALTDINVYNLHFVTRLFGRPQSIQYVANLGYNQIDTSGVVLMRYPDMIAVCTGAKDCSSPYCAYIQGDEGTIRMDQGSIGVCAHVDFIPPKGDMIGKKDQTSFEELGVEQDFHMDYECRDFVRIMIEKDDAEYESLKQQTLLVVELLEKCKKQRSCQD